MSTSTTLIKQLREATYASYLDCARTLAAHDGDYDKALEQLRAVGLNKAEKKAERETLEGLIVVAREGDRVCALELDCETDFVALTPDFKAMAHRLAGEILADARLTDPESVLGAEFSGEPIAQAIKALVGKLGENIVLSRVARYEASPTHFVEGYIHVGALEGYGPGEGRVGVLIELAIEGDAAAIDAAAAQALAHDLALHVASYGPRYLAPETIPAADMAEQRAELETQVAAENKPEAIKARILEGRLEKFYRETCLLNQAYLKDDSLTVAALLQQQTAALGGPVRVVRFDRFALGD